jgi:ribosomal protein S18 acetylase RimI-like enzyme
MIGSSQASLPSMAEQRSQPSRVSFTRCPYSVVLKPEVALHGHIWTVYVDPAYRRRGIPRKLLAMAIEHLREIGCTTAVLHSSDAGEPLYEGLGLRSRKR